MARRSGWEAPWQPSGWRTPCAIPDVRKRDKITVPDPVLPHLEVEDEIRIISARTATPRERSNYEEGAL